MKIDNLQASALSISCNTGRWEDKSREAKIISSFPPEGWNVTSVENTEDMGPRWDLDWLPIKLAFRVGM